jgi:hypothetical protein
MTVPDPGQEEHYVLAETEGPETYPLVWDVDNPPDTNGRRTQYDVNTATFKKYSRKKISLATQDLHGCSSLAIVSRKGVYLTHYWESIGYRPAPRDLTKWGSTQEEEFKKYVLTGLRDGIKNKIREQDSLRDNAKALEDEHTYAYLIHPAPNRVNRQGYETDRAKIQAVVEEYLPSIKAQDRFTMVPYTVEPNAKIRSSTTKGRLLFKYDPEEALPPGKGMLTAKAMLWSETTVLYDDTWDYKRSHG